MSAIRRAMPFVVAATTGILSGIYIFKPMFVNKAHDRSVVPGQNITTSNYPESKPATNDKDIK